ncbi:MAG: PLP-dependent transferase [Opitutales bacterium]|nr:PLP-dependent transferase [Opitutales bacterium]
MSDSSSLRHYPLGDLIVDSPHSVCVSLPTMADVIGYEEKDPRVRNAMKGGYPRFFENRLIREVRAQIAQTLGVDVDSLVLFPNRAAAENAAAHCPQARTLRWLDQDAFCGMIVPSAETELRQALHFYQQHTGHMLSSREAEDWLIARGLRSEAWPESLSADNPEAADLQIREHLHDAYRTDSVDDIYLFRGGMSAFYAGFQCLRDLQQTQGKHVWVQLGWLYVDTIRVLEKWAIPGKEPVIFHKVLDLDALERLFASHGPDIAGVVTEIPTNPLVQTTDLPRLREICSRFGAALILDPTMASPHNVNILPYSDLHVNSLTKYASHEADTLIGALGLNTQSPFYAPLKDQLPAYRVPPHGRDLRRLASMIHRYPDVVEGVNATTPKVVEWLERHPLVESVWWARSAATAAEFDRIAHKSGGPGCMISFKLKQPIQPFYDRLRMAKTPSFGARFSMVCPFLYLAHYDLVSSPDGRRILESAGIPPELIRLSIGLEPAEAIISSLDQALTPQGS